MRKYANVKRPKRSQRTAVNAGSQHKLQAYVWLYFMVFVTAILLLLWLFQIVFLPSYYKSMKFRDIKSSATKIYQSVASDEFEDVVEDVAFENNMCVVITDLYGNPVVLANYRGGESPLTENYGIMLFEMRNKLAEAENGVFYTEIDNPRFNTTEVIYGLVLDNYNSVDSDYAYLFINTFLDPIDSTVSIIKEEFFYIVIIVFELALLISIYISKRLSRPIVKMAESAKKFAGGDFSVEFDGQGYQESEQLADSLNYAVAEVSKVANLRKDLIANVSHDLKTPLTMVKAYAEMIRDLSGDNPEKRNEHLGVIIDEADRLSSLVNEILELSKLESGNKELELSEFTIHDKMDEILQRYQILIDNDGFDITFEADENRLCKADCAKIDQVLYNLINNAVNYCGGNKRIIIRQKNNGNSVRIEVVDFGVGIKKELLPLIFDRYYRAERNQRDTIGTGLGLSIVKEILRLHSYPFGVTSEEGKGSTFWFEFTDTSFVEE